MGSMQSAIAGSRWHSRQQCFLYACCFFTFAFEIEHVQQGGEKGHSNSVGGQGSRMPPLHRPWLHWTWAPISPTYTVYGLFGPVKQPPGNHLATTQKPPSYILNQPEYTRNYMSTHQKPYSYKVWAPKTESSSWQRVLQGQPWHCSWG